VFEKWTSSADCPTLYRVERDVLVDVSRLFPDVGQRRQDELPLWVNAHAVRLEPWMRACQTAWLRRPDGGWLAIVLMPASSADGQSSITMQLWLEPDLITTDLTVGNSAPQ
jgi:hypothetical protein